MPESAAAKAANKNALAKPMPGGSSAQKNGRVLSSNELNARPLDPIKQCYEAWDAGTHLSKERWRELCRINLGDREKLGRR